MKAGLGFDIHRFKKGRPLILGGVRIPHKAGLMGHSDADALTHAVIDALLGAMGQSDIGELFPDTSKKYKNMSSMIMLRDVVGIMKKKGFVVNNMDVNIITEEPKLKAYKKSMQKSLAKTLGVKLDIINIKAKTMEGLGSIGHKKALAVQSVVTIKKKRKRK